MKLFSTMIVCAIAVSAAAATGGILTYDLVSNSHLIESKQIQVEFRNYDGTYLWSDIIAYGADATYKGAVPKRENGEYYTYTFSSWDKPLSKIREDTVFYAKFSYEPKKLDVTFVNYDKSELYVDHVYYGNTAVYVGPLPTKPKDEINEYRFTGWDIDLKNIREDCTAMATYEAFPLQYNVSFYNGDALLYSDKVSFDGTAIYQGLTPTKIDPTDLKHDYVFVGWDKGTDHIRSDTEFHAVFEKVDAKYRVNFYNYDNTLIYTDFVPEGGTAVFYGITPTKPSDDDYFYVFDGWTKPLDNITNDLSVVAKFAKRERQYYVTFFNGDKSQICSVGTNYGGTVIYPGAEPTKASDDKYDYYFSGWDRPLTNITGDIDVYPLFDKTLRFFNCVFKNYDGTILYETTVEYGSSALYYGPSPVKETAFNYYDWVGWDKDTKNITEDTEFIAKFEPSNKGGGGPNPNPAAVVYFYNYDGTILDGDVANEGIADYEGPAPTRPDGFVDTLGYRTYTFVGWDVDITNIPESFAPVCTYAQYKTNNGEYIVTYRNLAGEIIFEDYVYPGQNSSYRGADYDYLDAYNGFQGWSQDLNNIQNSITVYPVIGGLML